MLRRRFANLPAIMAGLLALTVALPLDTPVHVLTFRYVVSHEVRLVSNGLTQLGTGWAAVGLLSSVAILGHRTADTVLLRASLGGLVGIGLGGLTIQVVKVIACRARPRLVDGWGVGTSDQRVALPHEAVFVGFFHWPCWMDTRYHGFPSGHTTVAFVVAAALCHAVPTRRRFWFAIAGSIALSRILLNAHFLSDVIGAALLGWWAGRAGIELVGPFVPLRAGRTSGLPAQGTPCRVAAPADEHEDGGRLKA